MHVLAGAKAKQKAMSRSLLPQPLVPFECGGPTALFARRLELAALEQAAGSTALRSPTIALSPFSKCTSSHVPGMLLKALPLTRVQRGRPL